MKATVASTPLPTPPFAAIRPESASQTASIKAFSTCATYFGSALVDSSYASFLTSGDAWSNSPGRVHDSGPDECECDAPIRIESAGIPVFSSIAFLTF